MREAPSREMGLESTRPGALGLWPGVYVELCRRIERVADRLFEGEETVLHVIERIVAPWVSGSTQRHLEWTRDFRTALGCRPVFFRPFDMLIA